MGSYTQDARGRCSLNQNHAFPLPRSQLWKLPVSERARLLGVQVTAPPPSPKFPGRLQFMRKYTHTHRARTYVDSHTSLVLSALPKNAQQMQTPCRQKPCHALAGHP